MQFRWMQACLASFLLLCCGVMLSHAVNVTVYSDVEFYNSMCDNSVEVIFITKNLTLYYSTYPSSLPVPCIRTTNINVTGIQTDWDLYPSLNFNFVSVKVKLQPGVSAFFIQLMFTNFRYGAGGQLDYFAYSPNAIVWNINTIKNQQLCGPVTQATINSLLTYPTPLGSEWANVVQNISLIPDWCAMNRCWKNSILYETFAGPAVIGPTDPAGYILAKHHNIKTCDRYVTPACTNANGTVNCLLQDIVSYQNQIAEVATIDDFLTALCNSTIHTIALMSSITLPQASAATSSPCQRPGPLEIQGAASEDLIVLNFNYAKSLVQLTSEPLVTFVNLQLVNTRYGSGEHFDFLVPAPNLTVVLQATNRNELACVPVDLTNVYQAASPSSASQFAVLPVACSGSTCWNNALDFTNYTMDETYGSGSTIDVQWLDSNKTCNWFASSTCITSSSADICVQALVDAHINDNQQDAGAGSSSSTNLGLAIGLGVGLGCALIFALVCGWVYCQRSKRAKAAALAAVAIDEELGKPASDGGKRKKTGSVGSEAAWLASGDSHLANTCTAADGTLVAVDLNVLVGSGSCGTVYKGLAGDQVVAIKVIRHTPEVKPAVEHEVSIMLQVRHPHVLSATHYLCQPYKGHGGHGSEGQAFSVTSGSKESVANLTGTGTGTGTGSTGSGNSETNMLESWIVQEFCDRGSLLLANVGETLRRNGGIDLVTGLRLLCGIADGMAHLHGMNVVHGDLKSANVLLTGVGADVAEAGDTFPAHLADGTTVVAKVADFGVSRSLAAEQTHQTTNTVGTLTHMAPEVLRAGKLSPASDVYSFGIIMWEVAMGDVPYRGLMHGHIVERVCLANERPQFGDHVPAAYAEVAAACWATDPASRPTFAEVVKRLQHVLARITEAPISDLPACDDLAASAPVTHAIPGGAGFTLAQLDDLTASAPTRVTAALKRSFVPAPATAVASTAEEEHVTVTVTEP